MAKVSETLLHPDFGELGWLPDYSHWFTQIRQPTGDWLDVIVEPGNGDRYAFIEPATELFRWALANERRILQDAMQAELLELYNDTWRGDDGPAMTADELTRRLEWTFLKISASEIVPVTFSYAASELFGYHCVDVKVNTQLHFRGISLVG